jgi:hypothetical protein
MSCNKILWHNFCCYPSWGKIVTNQTELDWSEWAPTPLTLCCYPSWGKIDTNQTELDWSEWVPTLLLFVVVPVGGRITISDVNQSTLLIRYLSDWSEWVTNPAHFTTQTLSESGAAMLWSVFEIKNGYLARIYGRTIFLNWETRLRVSFRATGHQI